MKIRSVSDVITNSSSEVFVIRLDKKTRAVDCLRQIKEFHEAHSLDYDSVDWEDYQKDPIKYRNSLREKGFDYFCSGDGGTLKILSDSRPGWVEIVVDENFEATHDYILSTFKVHKKFPC